jgi:hypothetical protein
VKWDLIQGVVKGVLMQGLVKWVLKRGGAEWILKRRVLALRTWTISLVAQLPMQGRALG